MDLQALADLFATTYNADPNVQKAGELQIRKIGAQEGVISALLEIIASDKVDLATRQACSVYLKNRVHTSYFIEPSRQRPEQTPIAQSDRDALKSSILRLLAASPSRAITLQLAATLKNLILHDFPDKWAGLLENVKALLNSGDIREVGAGCVAALECVRAFRYTQRKNILPHVVEQLFPTLVTVATGMLNAPPSSTQEIPTMLHLILKTYKSSIFVNLSAHQQSPESLVPWGRLFFQIVNLSIPPEVVPADEEERERCEWWKAKKWTYATLGRLFHRFGNPSQLPSPMKKEYAAFSQHFVTSFAPEIFQVYLVQINLYTSGQAWLSKKCLYHILSFYTECIKPKATWTLLKPQVMTLVGRVVYPQLCFDHSRQQLWESDPIEYVRASVDEYENFSSPVSAAVSFVLSLASNRTKTAFRPMLDFIYSVLSSNPSPPEKFGVLSMAAVLGPFMMRHPDVRGNMEQFMVQYVLPAFSAEPYLRSIACDVLGTVVKNGMQWTSNENLESHSRAVAIALDDPELPVRVQAALALTKMAEAYDSVRDAIAPQVGKVIQDLLKLSDETDLDVLNNSMEAMVERFQDELLPVATQLTGRLCESYMRLAREGLAQQQNEIVPESIDVDSLLSEAEDDKVYGAMGVAKTIGTVVSAIESAADTLMQVQEVIIPIIRFTLENKLIELFDNMFDLVDSLTFRTHSISPNMWPIFELMYELFKSDAVDFLDEMLPSLDNFLSYGSDVFKGRPDYRAKVFDIYQTAMTSQQLGDNDKINSCKLAESVLLNLQGHVDDLLQGIIQIAFDNLDEGNGYSFKLANIEVLINTVYYNPMAALHLLENYKPGSSRVFFDKWFAIINVDSKLPTVHDKKLSILALCKLLEVDVSLVPEVLRVGWPGIVTGALNIFKSLPQAVAKRKALEERLVDEEDDVDEDDSRYLNLEGEEDDDVWDEDSAYLEMLAAEGARLREISEKRAIDIADVSDVSEESEIEEELGFFSLLDAINPYIMFKHALENLQRKDSALYQAATTILTVEQQTVLMEVMAVAESQNTTE